MKTSIVFREIDIADFFNVPPAIVLGQVITILI